MNNPPATPLPTEKIELVLVALSKKLTATVREKIDTRSFSLYQVDVPLHAVRSLQRGTSPRALLAIWDDAPSVQAVQDILHVGYLINAPCMCVLAMTEPQTVAGLLVAGLQEVIHVDDLTHERLRRVVTASISRDHRRRELVRARERALLKRDIVAAVAAAGPWMHILEVFADGLLALGAVGAACWDATSTGTALLLERGVPMERAHGSDLPLDAQHPAAACATQGKSAWYPRASELASTFTDWLPTENKGSIGFVPLFIDDEHVAVMAIAHELPPEEEMVYALEQLCGQVTEALRRSDLATRLLAERDADRRLLGVISHDLRNPLATITMSASFLSSRADDLMRPHVKRIDRAARVASSLTQDLLTFAKASADGLELALQEGDVFQVLALCAEDAKLRTTGGREVLLELAEGDGLAGIDSLRLEQAVGNLISNALTYSPPFSPVTVRGTSDTHAVYVEIENRGSTIDTATVAKLFEPMSRMSAIAEKGSLGLGLFIVNRIMTAHGGRVWVEPAQPDGVKFCLQVPRRSTPQASPAVVSLSHRPLPARASASRAPLDDELVRLVGTFRSLELGDVVAVWASARSGKAMPHPLTIERSRLLGYMPDMIMACVLDGEAGAPVFRWNEIGPRLERRLQGTLVGQQLASREYTSPASQYTAYLRCWQERRCIYDYVRQRGAAPFSFERLLLPLSRDGGRTVTHIMGVIRFG